MGLTLLSFILVMSVIVFVHEFGHLMVAKRNKIVVEEFGFGFPPRVVKLFERDGTIYSLNAIPFGGFARMRGEEDPTQQGSFASASRPARAATLLAGAGMNFLLSIVLVTALTLISGIPNGAIVNEIAPGSPAERAGVLAGDRILSANGTEVLDDSDLLAVTRANLGKPVDYTILREVGGGGEARTLILTMVPRVNPPEGEGSLGIRFDVSTRKANLLEAAVAGVRETGNIIAMTFAIPFNLLREGRPLGDAGFMGPIGIAKVSGDVVRGAVNQRTFLPILWFMAALSTALGITNLLPLPALDGGRLLFVLAEALRGGRRIDPAHEGLVHLIGFGLLLTLMAVVSVREIGALINGTFPTF